MPNFFVTEFLEFLSIKPCINLQKYEKHSCVRPDDKHKKSNSHSKWHLLQHHNFSEKKTKTQDDIIFGNWPCFEQNKTGIGRAHEVGQTLLQLHFALKWSQVLKKRRAGGQTNPVHFSLGLKTGSEGKALTSEATCNSICFIVWCERAAITFCMFPPENKNNRGNIPIQIKYDLGFISSCSKFRCHILLF